jgi:Putative Actinobacterial Holin-X, holin superfamily III
MAERHHTMPRMPREKPTDESMFASLHRLSRDGRSWLAAEAALAQAEVASDGRRLAEILGFIALVIGCLLAALILLSVFFVAVLAPYVGGMANAAGLLSLGLIIVAALASWRIWHLSSEEFGLLAVFKRWWSIAATGPGATHD